MICCMGKNESPLEMPGIRAWRSGQKAGGLPPGTWRCAQGAVLLPDTELGHLEEGIERLKASIRAKVEHPFHIIKNLLGLKKARTVGWPRTRRSCIPCLVWPIW